MTTDKLTPEGLSPLALPQINNPEGYKTAMQNNAINQFTRINSKKDTTSTTAFRKEVKSEAVSVIMKATQQLTPREAQMFMYLDAKFDEQANSPEVKFTLKDYQADFGKKDAKNARKMLKSTLDNIVGVSYSYSGGDPDKPYNQNFGKHVLIEGYDYNRGKVSVNFSPFFHDLLVNSMPMPLHPLYFKLEPVREAAALQILYELLLNKRQNIGKPRADRMKVKTLLSKVHSLPSYDEVMKSNGATSKRIIEPFFKAIERIANPEDGVIVDYTFVDNKGNILDYETLEYADFIEATLIIKQWKNYPEELLKQWAKTRKDFQKKVAKKSKNSKLK